MKTLIASLAAAAALSATDVHLPPYTHQLLANGIVLDVMPRHDLPLVTIHIVVRGGAESEPAGNSGLASATAEALRRGTATRTADAFSRELDFLGASFHTAVNMQATTITAEFLSKDLDKGLA